MIETFVQNMSSSPSIFSKIDAEHAGFVGATAAIGSYGLYGYSDVPLFGMNVPSPLFSFGVVFAANYITQIADDQFNLVGEIPLPKSFKKAEVMMIPVLTTGLATYSINRLVSGPEVGFVENMGLGGASQLVGSYVQDMLQKNATTGTV